MLALIAAASLLVAGDSAVEPCGRPVPDGPRGLPAAVAIHTTCGGFVLAPSGRVARAPMPSDWPKWAPIGSWRAGPGTYVSARFGRILVVRDGRTVWRSSRRYRFPNSVAVGRHALAFSLNQLRAGPVYVARFGGRERLVFHGEHPTAFLPSGLLLTQSWHRGRATLRLRSLDGRLVRVIASRARTATFDEQTRSVFYVTSNRMVARFDGRHRVGLARVPSAFRWPWLHALGDGFVAIVGDRGIAVVRPHGGLLASTQLRQPTRKRAGVVLNGDAVVSSARAVAFTSSWRPPGFKTYGVALVSVLRPGDRRATVVYRHPVASFGCGWGTWLEWRGKWLLYRESSTQRLVALDTVRDRTVDLTRFARSLPGRRSVGFQVAFRADWAGSSRSR